MYSSWRMNTKACGNSVPSTRIRRLPEIVLHRVLFSRNVCATLQDIAGQTPYGGFAACRDYPVACGAAVMSVER
jgi:hypothetical protein